MLYEYSKALESKGALNYRVTVTVKKYTANFFMAHIRPRRMGNAYPGL